MIVTRARRSARTRSLALRALSLAVAVSVGCGPAAAADLGYFDMWYTVTAVSGDGRTVVGGWQTHSPVAPDTAAYVRPDGVIVSIGRLHAGDQYARLVAASHDGAVLAGNSYACTGTIRVNCVPAAFRWTQAAGMVALSNPGAGWTYAADVSGDGRYVVGSVIEPFSQTATLWHPDLHAETLGVLDAGGWSGARAVSFDGSVVVGTAGQSNSDLRQAFRWTRATGMVGLGTIAGYDSSEAYDVSANGDVVVGSAWRTTQPWQEQAMRWTAAGGMQGLGFLAGTDRSSAHAISGDGRVIVGYSIPRLNLDYQGASAFRWTEATGMQAFSTWLSGNGVTVPSNITLLDAFGINHDGSVTVGLARDTAGPFGIRDIGWIARVDANGAGLITDIDAYRSGLAESAAGAAGMAEALPRATFDGAHRRSLLDRGIGRGDDSGDRNCAWGSADIDFTDERQQRRQWFEAGACRDLGDWRLGLGLTGSSSRQTLGNGGRQRTTAHHLTAEVATRFGSRIEADVQATYGEFDMHLLRRYANGANVDASLGTPSGHYEAVRVRGLARDLWHAGNTGITPYVALARTRSTLSAFTETRGAFPARYTGARCDATEATVGAMATIAAGAATTVTPTLEYTHRLAEPDATVHADTGGLLGIDVAADAFDRNAARLSIDIDHRFGERGHLRLSLIADSRDAASLGLGAVYAATF